MLSWGQCFSPSHTRSCLLPLQSEKLSWEKGLGRQGTVPGEGNVLKTQGSVLPAAHPQVSPGNRKAQMLLWCPGGRRLEPGSASSLSSSPRRQSICQQFGLL